MCFCLDLAYEVGVINLGKLGIEFDTISVIFMFYTLKAPHKVKVPVGSAELSVSDGMEAKLLLLCDQLCDLIVYNLIIGGLIQIAFLVGSTCLLECLRT